MSLRVATANLDWATGDNKDRAHLEHLCKLADVLLLQETKNIHVDALLPDGWTALQDRTDTGRAGVAIAYNAAVVDRGGWSLRVGARPFIGRRRVGMLTRYILAAHFTHEPSGTRCYAVSAHLPPKRFALLQPPMMRRLRRMGRGHARMVLGSDLNQPYRTAAAFLNLKAVGSGIDAIAVGPAMRVLDHDVDHYGKRRSYTGHPAVIATIKERAR